MAKNYLMLFWLSLLAMLFFAITLTTCVVFFKKIVVSKKYAIVFLAFISVIMLGLSLKIFIPCCKDYKYFASGTYIEQTATVVEFTYVKRDDHGTGEIMYRNPKFQITETGEHIILHTKNVSVGETYTIRYYPNTKICEVTKTNDNAS